MKCKALHLLRHAVAVHNQPEAAAKLPPEALFDPGLTAQGFAQAQALRPLVQNLGAQLVVASPLTRALQTAVSVLSGKEGATATDTASTSSAGSGGGSGSGASPPASSGPATPPPIVAVEAVREAYGQYLPDKRRTRAELAAAFSPPVDLSALPEEDALWTPRRETLDSVLGRARAFVEEVLRRPERRVLVVSHGVFLQCVLQELLGGEADAAAAAAAAAAGASPDGGGSGKQQAGRQGQGAAHPDYDPSRPVLNCELYTVIFVEVDARFLASPAAASPGPSPGLASPPLLRQPLWSPPAAGAGCAAGAAAVRQLLVTPATHELLASSGLSAQVRGEVSGVVCGWMDGWMDGDGYEYT
jgi:broad specificity phosphatase PhoE